MSDRIERDIEVELKQQKISLTRFDNYVQLIVLINCCTISHPGAELSCDSIGGKNCSLKIVEEISLNLSCNDDSMTYKTGMESRQSERQKVYLKLMISICYFKPSLTVFSLQFVFFWLS